MIGPTSENQLKDKFFTYQRYRPLVTKPVNYTPPKVSVTSNLEIQVSHKNKYALPVYEVTT